MPAPPAEEPAEEPAEAPEEDPFATPPAAPPAEEPPADDPFAPPAEKPAAEPAANAPADDPFSSTEDINQLRTWTDATGKYKLDARFVEIIDGKVRLQMSDGRYFRIEMDKLCAADLDLVLRHVSKIAQY